MASLVNGMSFVLRYAKNPSFSMEHSILSINPSAAPEEQKEESESKYFNKIKRNFKR